MAKNAELRWLRLDNAAKIYPAAKRRDWVNVFRLSATLTEQVDVSVLQNALDVTVKRFPSIAARLRRGMFWYYIEQLKSAPKIRQENSYPLVHMSRSELGKCGIRVIVYQNRIAVEIFHGLTDATGGLIFLKNLVAEYLEQKYSITIPAEDGILNRKAEPLDEEFEDSFLRCAGPVHASRKAEDAWRIIGTPEKDGFLHLTCFQIPADEIKDCSRTYGVSVTALLSAVMTRALLDMQAEIVPNPKWRKFIKVFIPVDLRRIFPSRTLRNFILYFTSQIDPRQGEYSFAELCQTIHHQMALEIQPKPMAAMIATNVSTEKSLPVRLAPLFLKNLIMKAVYDAVGERKTCVSISNLGITKLPDVMARYVSRMEFILGVQATLPCNCGVLTYGDTVYMNFIRKIQEPDLELHYFRVLQSLGIHVAVESNQPR